MKPLSMFVKSENKVELIDETRLEIKKTFNITVPSGLVARVINDRANTVKKGIENKIPRIIIGGIGSFVIKQGKSRFAVKLGREYYVRKNTKDRNKLEPRFRYEYKVVSHGEEV